MLACIDVQYYDNLAVAGCILFNDWSDSIASVETHTTISEITPYSPGKFYLRELPCILKVLSLVTEDIEMILIDGYVWLDNHQTPGLGAYLYNELGRKTPVIGIAKSQYKRSEVASKVIRGKSRKPLYVTAAGVDQDLAAKHIAEMHGKYRIPTLLKKADKLSRNIYLK